jgi:hypothetical protein
MTSMCSSKTIILHRYSVKLSHNLPGLQNISLQEGDKEEEIGFCKGDEGYDVTVPDRNEAEPQPLPLTCCVRRFDTAMALLAAQQQD